jgi:hypothetical protein
MSQVIYSPVEIIDRFLKTGGVRLHRGEYAKADGSTLRQEGWDWRAARPPTNEIDLQLVQSRFHREKLSGIRYAFNVCAALINGAPPIIGGRPFWDAEILGPCPIERDGRGNIMDLPSAHRTLREMLEQHQRADRAITEALARRGIYLRDS